MKLQILSCALILTLASTSALAISEQQFNNWDLDGNGEVSLEEMIVNRANYLKKKGRDISKAEKIAKRNIKQKDTDGNGSLSFEELK